MIDIKKKLEREVFARSDGITTTNVIPLADGPSLFFAQRIDGNLNECNSGTQTIQVAWNGGITPYISDDTESDLFQYYIGYSDSSGVLIPHVPISIADINDNDNFHQLCFSTSCLLYTSPSPRDQRGSRMPSSA